MRDTATPQLPGDKDFWLFIVIDAAMFSAVCVSLAYFHYQQPLIFAAGQAALSVPLGLINTLILLSSSLAVALGVRHLALGQIPQTRRCLQIALACGAAFAGIKLAEYAAALLEPSLDLSSGFFVHYFSITGLHLFHLIGGMAALTLALKKLQTDPNSLVFVESAGLYWHLVDAIWVLLFFQFYLSVRPAHG